MPAIFHSLLHALCPLVVDMSNRSTNTTRCQGLLFIVGVGDSNPNVCQSPDLPTLALASALALPLRLLVLAYSFGLPSLLHACSFRNPVPALQNMPVQMTFPYSPPLPLLVVASVFRPCGWAGLAPTCLLATPSCPLFIIRNLHKLHLRL